MAAERKLYLLILSSTVPVVLLLFWLWMDGSVPRAALGAAMLLIFGWLLVVAHKARSGVLRHVRAFSNLLEAIQKEDYGIKAARARDSGELGELYRQLNALTEGLKVARHGEHELLQIMEKILSQIDVAIIVFDARDRIRLANETACALLKTSQTDLCGTARADTVLASLPPSAESGLIDFRFPGGTGRWQVREHQYRHQGEASRILFIADLDRVLSDHEIAAWQRLIRIIAHEVNNSLTPIASLCQTLATLISRQNCERDADVHAGLHAIAERAARLQEFISAYARLAKLPSPDKKRFGVDEIAQRMAQIFDREPLVITPFPDVMIFADPVHLEQALINLIKNALEASAGTNAEVLLRCEASEGECRFLVIDSGSGIADSSKLFVPFYSTKPGGAGIGLLLSQHIAANHHGHISLQNRGDAPGAVACLSVPVSLATAST